MDSLESKTAEHLIALGKEKKHCRQLIVAIDKKGKTDFKGNLEKRLPLKELQKIDLWPKVDLLESPNWENALQKEWLPIDIPSLIFLAPWQRY